MSKLKDRAMLVRLTISSPSGQKHDANTSRQVEEQHKTKGRAGRYFKEIIRSDHLDLYGRLGNSLRGIHYELTSPWMDGGLRILPSELFYEYRDAVRKITEECEKAKAKFLEDYESGAVQERAALRLGDLYSAEDYPTTEQMRQKFGINYSVFPVPSAEDWRVDLADEDVKEIQEDIERQVNEAQERALRDLYSRLYAMVERVHERLADEDKTFHSSLIENAKELTELLPKLNVMGDARLAQLTEEAKKKLTAYNTDTLRHDYQVRNKVATDADEILRKMQGVF